MLRTYALALTAADTVGGSACSCLNQTVVKCLGSEFLIIQGHSINGSKHIRDTYLHRAAVTAVTAGGTSDLLYIKHYPRNLLHSVPLLLGQGLKILKGLDIILHLILVGHT